MCLSGIEVGIACVLATLSTLLQGELNDVCVGLVKSSFAIRQIKFPQAQEFLIKAQLQNLRLLRHEVMAPASQCFCIVWAKLEFVNHLQACQTSLTPKLFRAWQTTPWKDVLLNEVG